MLKHMLLFRVESKSEPILVEQVVEEVDLPIEVRFDNYGTTSDPNFFVNEGKPRMHLNLPCVLQSYFRFCFLSIALSD